MRGVVVDFDESVGLGRVRTSDGVELGFHCVEITDGSRRIAVGAEVVFRRGTGRAGADEAYELEVLSRPSA